MTDDGLPYTVMRFIEEYITSVEQLEILLLLSKSPATEFTVQNVYDIILSNRVSVEGWLERFVVQQLAQHSTSAGSTYRYHPPDSRLSSAVAALAEAYCATPVRVIEAIYKRDRNPPQRNSTDPAQGFADAFRLKQK